MKDCEYFKALMCCVVEHWYDCAAYGFDGHASGTEEENDKLEAEACECSVSVAKKAAKAETCQERLDGVRVLVSNYCHSDDCKAGDLIADMLEDLDNGDEDKFDRCMCYAKDLVTALREGCRCSSVPAATRT